MQEYRYQRLCKQKIRKWRNNFLVSKHLLSYFKNSNSGWESAKEGHCNSNCPCPISANEYERHNSQHGKIFSPWFIKGSSGRLQEATRHWGKDCLWWKFGINSCIVSYFKILCTGVIDLISISPIDHRLNSMNVLYLSKLSPQIIFVSKSHVKVIRGHWYGFSTLEFIWIIEMSPVRHCTWTPVIGIGQNSLCFLCTFGVCINKVYTCLCLYIHLSVILYVWWYWGQKVKDSKFLDFVCVMQGNILNILLCFFYEIWYNV